jgi:ABC-2 type transport system ATP-binding protein
MILGILSQDAGDYQWFEGKYKHENPRKYIGAILETPNFYPYLNAIDNLKIVAQIKDSTADDFEELLKMVELYDRRHSPFKTYSLGMKQRLAIAATLIGEPQVLIFDEPTNGLDPQGIAEVRNILQKIARSGKTVIMASHILDEVEKICSHVAIMKKGKLLASGPIGNILNNDIYIELGSMDRQRLKNAINDTGVLHITTENEFFVECTAPEHTSISDINKMMVDKGIYLTHLVGRKRKLEEEFLQITSKK